MAVLDLFEFGMVRIWRVPEFWGEELGRLPGGIPGWFFPRCYYTRVTYYVEALSLKARSNIVERTLFLRCKFGWI